MVNSQITLNGKDWSNLYLVDYPGGAGGEMFTTMLADNLGIEYGDKTSTLQSTVTDSCGNGWSSWNFPEYISNSLSVYNYQDTLNDINISMEVIKVLLHYWKEENNSTQKRLNLLSKKSSANPELFRNKAFDAAIKEDVVVRSHFYPNRYEEIPNAKVIRLWPKNVIKGKICVSRMVMLKWLALTNIKVLKDLPDELYDIAGKQNGKLFEWQNEVFWKHENNMDFHEFSKMVLTSTDSFGETIPHFDYDCNVIDSHDWLFNGLSDNDKLKFEKVTGIEYEENSNVKDWRKNNIEFMKSEGIDVNKDYDVNELAIKALKKYKKLCTQLKL